MSPRSQQPAQRAALMQFCSFCFAFLHTFCHFFWQVQGVFLPHRTSPLNLLIPNTYRFCPFFAAKFFVFAFRIHTVAAINS